MSVIRVNKTKDYSVISNHHIKDKNLSLKAKGLLSVMLALPDTWSYSVSGLVAICKENETSVNSALKELKDCGYLIVTKLMPNETKSGRIEYIYDVYEIPKQEGKKQDLENLCLENLHLENQDVENKGQLNINNKINNKEEINNINNINNNNLKNDLWENVLSMIERDFDENAFVNFFLPLIPKSFINNKLVIEAPSRLVKEVIQSSMFINKIYSCLNKITNTNCLIEVIEKK